MLYCLSNCASVSAKSTFCSNFTDHTGRDMMAFRGTKKGPYQCFYQWAQSGLGSELNHLSTCVQSRFWFVFRTHIQAPAHVLKATKTWQCLLRYSSLRPVHLVQRLFTRCARLVSFHFLCLRTRSAWYIHIILLPIVPALTGHISTLVSDQEIAKLEDQTKKEQRVWLRYRNGSQRLR